MAIDKIRPRKLNATADSRLRKADEMQDALNLVSYNDFRSSGDTTEGNDGTGNAGVLKPTRGTFEIPTSVPFFNSNDKKRVLGSVTDHAHNVVYLFVYCVNAAKQGVYAYDPTGFLPGSVAGEESWVKVFCSTLFRFPSDGFIKGDVVHINKAFESPEGKKYESQPTLYFTDNKNEPRKLHPFRALTEDFTDYSLVDTKDFITACPKAPVYPILAQYERDETESTTTFEGLPGFQFAYQNIYKGGEESALSTFSDIAVPQAYYSQGSASGADLDANNKCVLTIPTKGRTKEISEVRILRRIGNKGTWAVVDELTVEDLEGSDNTYNFFNRSIAGGFPAQTAIKPFDNLPQKAEAQAVVSDRLVYGNYVEGYDNLQVTASSSVIYHDRPEDFKQVDIKVIPTMRFVPNVGGETVVVPNKRSGFFIDTSEVQSVIEQGTTLLFNFTVKPNRNFHMYNSNDSFHGSRHLSQSDSDPKVVGDGALDAGETRGATSINQNLDTMFGANAGISVPGLNWTCVASQNVNSIPTDPIDVVFGTSAANPFILRGHPLSFSLKVKTKNTINSAPTVLKRVFTTLLASNVYEDSPVLEEDQHPYGLNQADAEDFEVIYVVKESGYDIDEGLASSVASTESSTEFQHKIDVSTGSDDRKHLIVSLLNYNMSQFSTTPNNLKHKTPCGYFIVNKAKPKFCLKNNSGSFSDGFLDFDLKHLSANSDDTEVLTAIPFINADKWKDEAYSESVSGGGYNSSNASSDNWGVRDATIWSLDSLIIDSWFCYPKSFLQNNNLDPKVFDQNSNNFPRYMNGPVPSLGLNPGDLNPVSENGGRAKNAATHGILSNLELFLGDGSNMNSNYAFRHRKAGVGAFKLKLHIPYLQAIDLKDSHLMKTFWQQGRDLMVGFLGGFDNLLEDTSRQSIVDGAIGPGGALEGRENVRKFQGGVSDYSVGSVSGEMVFSGRIAGRGFFKPEAMKAGEFQGDTVFSEAVGFHQWFHQYGLEPMLPHFGGIGYQKHLNPNAGPSDPTINSNDAVFGNADIGYIPNWHYQTTFDNTDFTNTTVAIPSGWDSFSQAISAVYLGSDDHIGDWGEIVNVDSDLELSENIEDAPIRITGSGLSLTGGGEWASGGRSFKTRANHAFGIVYYDERGRSGKVNPIVFNGSPGVYVSGYSPSERGGGSKGRVSVNIDLSNTTPPPWAHNYQIVYGGNTTKSNFIQYSTGGAFVGNKKTDVSDNEENQDEESTNIYVSLNYLQGNKDVSYAEAFGAVSPLGTKNLYTYKPGDRLRVLSYYTRPDARVWVEDVEFEIIGVENVSSQPSDNIFYNAYDDVEGVEGIEEDGEIIADVRTGQFLVLKNNPKAEGFNFSSVNAGRNTSSASEHNWNNICVVEIYSPSKEVDIESRLFYETSKVYDVAYVQNLTSSSSSLKHVPSTVSISRGDVWFKPVALATSEYGENEFLDDDAEISNPYHNRFRNLIGRLPSAASTAVDPGSYPRFRNYYVESMTFNDGFAGNNVLGIGKPNTVDKDVFQVRKGSSVIYSDKHDFSKRGLRFPSFNGTASNWKDLPNEHGKINFLLNNYDSLMCIQENKSSSIPVERNIISDASGANTLITSNKVIGVQAFFAGEYGCDNNPESVVKTDAATYFASKAKSEVYRLTSQGIQVISKEGMASYFFRLFEEAKKAQLDGQGKIYIPGGYDPLKDEFLVTISNIKSFNTTGEQEVEQDYINPVVVPEEDDENDETA